MNHIGGSRYKACGMFKHLRIVFLQPQDFRSCGLRGHGLSIALEHRLQTKLLIKPCNLPGCTDVYAIQNRLSQGISLFVHRQNARRKGADADAPNLLRLEGSLLQQLFDHRHKALPPYLLRILLTVARLGDFNAMAA